MSKTVIITGGSRGIGSAVSSLFAENGYNVVINYNRFEQAAIELKDKLCKKGFRAVTFKADIGDSEEADALINFAVSKFGRIDVLVNNAGIAQQKLFTDISDSDWSNMLNIDLSGAFYCTRAAVKDMLRRHSGSVINISSMWGVVGASCEVHYSAAKAGVIGITKALAKELGPSNIRVNCVAPGVIATEMNSKLSAEELGVLSDETPLSRLGTPEDVAKAVYFLASDDASFITGQILGVDGGFIL